MSEYDTYEMIQRIKRIKKLKKITNERLSYLSGVPLGTLNKILGTETKEPQLGTIVKISDALEVSANEIIFGDGKINDGMSAGQSDGEILSLDGRRIGHAYDQASEDDKVAISAILRKYMSRVSSALASQTAKAKKIPRRKIPQSVPTYAIQLSAETGVIVVDGVKHEAVMVSPDVPRGTDLGIRVKGNYLEPHYRDGQILWVKWMPRPDEDKIGVLNIDGELFVRKLTNDLLFPLSKEYRKGLQDGLFKSALGGYEHVTDKPDSKTFGRIVAVTGDEVILDGEEFGTKEEPMIYTNTGPGFKLEAVIDQDQRRIMREMSEKASRGEIEMPPLP